MVTDPAIKPIKRIDTQCLRRKHTDHVLHDEHTDDASREEQKGTATLGQHSGVGAQTDRCEKRQHESGLYRRVERESHADCVQRRDEKRRKESANDRRGNRILLQEPEAFDQVTADD
jgi:hypothetical protein